MNTMNHYAMHTEDLSLQYEDKAVLDHVSVSFPEHRITAVMGPSGCGKTTLLRCLNGMIGESHNARMTGDIYLGGQNIRDLKREELTRRVGLVFQTPAPFPFSIEKNMTYALKYYGVKDRAELRRITEEKLRITGLYEEVKDEMKKSALQLSGGQQQRLCIARALTVEPEVLLLDEPCSALDIRSTLLIEEMLKKCREDYTIVLVTHNIAQARRIADHVVFLYDHHVLEQKGAEEFFEAPEHEETGVFLEGILN